LPWRSNLELEVFQTPELLLWGDLGRYKMGGVNECGMKMNFSFVPGFCLDQRKV
jgi:hypothetical protein